MLCKLRLETLDCGRTCPKQDVNFFYKLKFLFINFKNPKFSLVSLSNSAHNIIKNTLKFKVRSMNVVDIVP